VFKIIQPIPGNCFDEPVVREVAVIRAEALTDELFRLAGSGSVAWLWLQVAQPDPAKMIDSGKYIENRRRNDTGLSIRTFCVRLEPGALFLSDFSRVGNLFADAVF
jgi:hypothetical protein